MQVSVFSTKPYDRSFLEAANVGTAHRLLFHEPRLTEQTAPLAAGSDAVCLFVNDVADAETLSILARQGIRLVALRCAGFNHVDLAAARDLKITVSRVPAYSPHAVAEHTLALILALNRQIHRAYNRVREGNFALDGLIGFDLYGKTVGVVGTGQIGAVVVRILTGFGCRVLAFDPYPDAACVALGARYVSLDELGAESDVVTLHCPLTPDTNHLVDARFLARAKKGLMLINTGRGALIDTRAAIRALKNGSLGSLGIDVYEEEADLFFEDLSSTVLRDDVFARLLTFPNVLITGHQAFLTREALSGIATTTIANISAFAETGRAVHEVSVERLA
ncbi:2-hydroxyacid dehydrogenase [Aurantimonas sp. A2-1-M11]|uniref:2-hydroxyacid dehydrogenase n=1 Tax=Aurantimonas sp. A2-1-M11 TaxID=3113712 RepID=UPI002F95BCE9